MLNKTTNMADDGKDIVFSMPGSGASIPEPPKPHIRFVGPAARSFGIKPGKYIRLYQGFAPEDLNIKEISERPADMHFDQFDNPPPLLWGSGIYLVRVDETLQLVAADWDTSG